MLDPLGESSMALNYRERTWVPFNNTQGPPVNTSRQTDPFTGKYQTSLIHKQ